MGIPKISLAIILILLAMPLILAETVKLNSLKDLSFTCTLNNEIPSASTEYNITINYPNGSVFVDNKAATAKGQGLFNYTITFPLLGTYKIHQFCYDGTYSYSNTDEIIVTPSGEENISEGVGLSFIGSLIVMIIIGLVFFIVGFQINNVIVKVSFLSFAVIIFIMAILFITISAQQNMYNYPGLVTGIESFWFVMKMLLTAGILIFFVIVGLIMLKAWKIKRGLIDY